MKGRKIGSDCRTSIGPEPRVAGALIIVSLLVVLSIMLSALNGAMKTVLIVAALVYATICIRERLRPSIVGLAWESDRLLIRFRRGRTACITPGPGSFISPLFIGLGFRSPGQRFRRLGLFRAQVDSEFWRQSMIRLREMRPD